METPSLVPGRECGTCVVCCKVPLIDEKTLFKPAGVLCPHSTGSSCGIYAARPETCRAFHCQWRHLPFLDENWRPDLSGVLIRTRVLAHGDDSGAVLNIIVFENREVIFDEGFARVVAIVIERGVEVILTLLRDDGTFASETALAAHVGPGVAAGSVPEVMAGIRRACLLMEPSPPA